MRRAGIGGLARASGDAGQGPPRRSEWKQEDYWLGAKEELSSPGFAARAPSRSGFVHFAVKVIDCAGIWIMDRGIARPELLLQYTQLRDHKAKSPPQRKANICRGFELKQLFPYSWSDMRRQFLKLWTMEPYSVDVSANSSTLPQIESRCSGRQ